MEQALRKTVKWNLGREGSKCKGSEIEKCLINTRNNKKPSIAEGSSQS